MNKNLTLLLIALIGLLFPLHAQQEYKVTIDLINVSKERDRVKVTIITPPIRDKVVRYVLPAHLPGLSERIDGGRFVHQFYGLDERGNPYAVRKQGKNIIVMRNPGDLALHKIEYWIDDTWDVEKINPRQSDKNFNYVPQYAGTNINAGKNFLLNFGTSVGFIAGYENLPYQITVAHGVDMFGSSALPVIRRTKTEDHYQAINYAALLDSPMMYGVCDTLSFRTGKVNIHLAVFSENNKISARYLRRLLAVYAESFDAFIATDIATVDYSYLFYFTDPKDSTINTYGSYGGLDHEHGSFYFLPETDDMEIVEMRIRTLCKDALLHSLFPWRQCDASTNKIAYQEPVLHAASWFEWGIQDYFTQLSGLRDSMLNEESMLQHMGNIVTMYQHTEIFPLSSVSLLRKQLKSSVGSGQAYYRSSLTMFMLDMELCEASDGKKSIRDFLFYCRTKPPAEVSDSLHVWLSRYGGPRIETFLNRFVYGKEKFDLMDQFNRIGWAYAPNSVDSVLSFGEFGFVFDEKQDAFYVAKAETPNLFGLKNNDRIVTVNDIVVSGDNFELALYPIFRPVENQAVIVRFIRDNKNETSEAEPEYHVMLVQHVIRIDPDCGAVRKLLHDRLLFDHF
jgi:predicted metalloprotease with PDZ domain